MSDPLLRLRGVEVGFGGNTVLHGVDLDVEPGTCLGIFGLNGAGKSVTMKAVAGVLPVRSGSISFDGDDITRLSPEARVRRGLAYAPQGRQLFPKLTVEQNLRLGGYLMRRRSKRAYAESLAELYGLFPRLAERRDQLAGMMSGGEQAMLTIARALVCRPRMLLIDEPSAGLSPAAIADCEELLQRLRATGMTILLVEQNITFGFRVVDQAAIMQRGQIVYTGRIAELDTARVAELLGIGRLLGPQLQKTVARSRSTAAKKAAPRRRAART
jgi:branched-chain amino acid transport system ATP-binding protein